jgi:hypothetical protein
MTDSGGIATAIGNYLFNWKQGKEYIRIVRLERLEVEYKSLASLASKEGTKHVASKKDFCRLLKQARLLQRDKIPNPVIIAP